MKTKLIICIILLFCIVISSVGCFEQYKFWDNPSIISDPNRVWIDDEHDIWFVYNRNNLEFYGQIVIDSNTYNFDVGTLPHSGGFIAFLIYDKSDERFTTDVNMHGLYDGNQLYLEAINDSQHYFPKGTKLVFKPYPRQAEHYLK
ncbi:MAG: hypothetical protein IJR55_01110 [Clostridia bacterium]|nr:hypothetical protein [Clostridia bacterium]